MTFESLIGPAPDRKCVLIVNSDTPGIENLRWKQLACRMTAQETGMGRKPHHAVEFREVPAGLFGSLFSSLVIQHGAAVAIACLHQTEDEQILVCTSDFFDAEVARCLRATEITASAMKSQLDEMQELIVSLDLLSLSGPEMENADV